VGNYYSTPIFAFRCKCHLCDGWFVIQTDPQNAQYVVTEGARKKEETWDPTENGGYAVFDTEAPSASEGGDGDAFAALEKDSAQQTAVRVQRSRLTELGDSSARISADPYAISKSLRDRFRIEKKEALAKQRRDEGLLDRYGLDPDLDLGNEDSKDEIDQVATAKWTAARENRGLPASAVPKPDLGSTIQKNTAARKFDVFEAEAVPRVRLKRKSEVKEVEVAPPKPPPPAVGLLAGYASSDDE
jgi:coiled-coil domain-containing protein 130